MLANIIKSQREQIGWTQKDFADKAKISVVTLVKVEKGERPSLKTLTKILRTLCLEIDDLLKHDSLTPEDVLYLENKKGERVYYEWQR